jgi:hypothetical protein
MHIKMAKGALVTALEKNRTAHAAEFAEARKAYEEAAIAELTANIESLRKGEKISRYLKAEQPTSYVSYYDKAIAMCKCHTDETIVLSTEQFAHYVQDEWEWREQFRNVTSSYKAS